MKYTWRDDARRQLLASSLTWVLVFIAVCVAYDYETPLVRSLITLPFWAAIRVSWWLEK